MDADGQTVLQGEPFSSSMFRLGNHRRERTMLQHLIAELAVRGWQAVPTGRTWYEHRIYHQGAGQVPVPASEAKREGLSTGTMWGWTVAIIILLFAVCVVLAFTSEIRFGPA